MQEILGGRKAYIERVLQDIKHISKEFSQKSVSRRQFHDFMQQRTVKLADRFNLKGSSEYRIPGIRADGRNGLIDVVWLTNSKPFAAFEIDSSFRPKSIVKLIAIDASFRFWIYYGSKSTSLLCKYDPENLIHMIQLQGIHFKKESKLE